MEHANATASWHDLRDAADGDEQAIDKGTEPFCTEAAEEDSALKDEPGQAAAGKGMLESGYASSGAGSLGELSKVSLKRAHRV